MQTLYSADLDHIRTCTSDIRSHAVQEVRHVNDMRLLRNILHDGQPFRHRRRHHDIDCRAYTDYIEINMLADKPVRLCYDLPMPDLYIRSKGTKSLEMLVYGPAPDIAPARKSHLGVLILSKQCAQEIVRRSDLLDIIVLYIKTADILPVNLHRVPVNSMDIRPNS